MSGEIQDLGDIDGSHTRCLGGGWQSVGMFGASLAAYVVLWAERGGVNFACVPVLLRSPCIIFAPASMRQMFFAAHLLLRHSRLECLLGSKVFSVSIYSMKTKVFICNLDGCFCDHCGHPIICLFDRIHGYSIKLIVIFE